MGYGFERDQNTVKLVMNTFHKLAVSRDGVSAKDIAKFLRDRYGDVWKTSSLLGKAERTLEHGIELGFLDKRGDRYIGNNMARTLRCCRPRPRRCRRRRRPKRCCRRRRSRCRRRPRRRRPCCCG